MKNNFMIGFVSKYYRTLIEVSLWISLILCIGLGWTGGDLVGAYRVNFFHRVLGVIFIGLPIFAAIMAMTGGFINILNMDKNIESIQKKLENEGTQASGEKKQAFSDNAENPLVL